VDGWQRVNELKTKQVTFFQCIQKKNLKTVKIVKTKQIMLKAKAISKLTSNSAIA